MKEALSNLGSPVEFWEHNLASTQTEIQSQPVLSPWSPQEYTGLGSVWIFPKKSQSQTLL